MGQADVRTDVLAFDVGGANIKAADGLGWIHSERFELWRRPAELPEKLAAVIRLRRPDRVVATMTGEIADCYPSRRVGVARIVAALLAAAGAGGRTAPVGIYLVDGSIVPSAEAVARPLAAAASNWHAMARLAAKHAATDRSLVIDAGSTTTDVVAIESGTVAPLAHDDAGRMASGELVYTGVERTPLAAIVRSLPLADARRQRGRRLQPLASERFADSRDAWILLGGIPEEPLCRDTADGAPATRDAARVRLARMLLVDPEGFSAAEASAAAEWCADAQARIVARAVRRVAAAHGWLPTSIVAAGHGACLVRRAIAHLGWNVEFVALPEKLGADVSRAAPAHALAMIARGMLA